MLDLYSSTSGSFSLVQFCILIVPSGFACVSSLHNTGHQSTKANIVYIKSMPSRILFSVFIQNTRTKCPVSFLCPLPLPMYTHAHTRAHSKPQRCPDDKLQLFPELFIDLLIYFQGKEIKHQDQLFWNCTFSLKLFVLHYSSKHWCHEKNCGKWPLLDFSRFCHVRHFLQQRLLSFQVQNMPFFEWKLNLLSFKGKEIW